MTLKAFPLLPPLRWITLGHGTAAESAVVRLALLAREGADGESPALVETRRLAGGRSYLAAVVDLEGRALEWLEFGVQSPQDLAESPAARCGLLSNALLDREWDLVVDALKRLSPGAVISSGAFSQEGQFWVVDFDSRTCVALTQTSSGAPLVICRDESRLREAKRSPYATSLERWFCAGSKPGEETWGSAGSLGELSSLPEGVSAKGVGKGPLFPLTPAGGSILLRRLPPISLEGFIG